MRSGGKEMGQQIKRGRQLNLKRELRVRVLGAVGGAEAGFGCLFSLYYGGSYVDTDRIMT